MTKSLLEQWNEDCQRLSNPHLQWEIMHPTRCSDYLPASYEQCELLIGDKCFDGCFRRIESLALPFDLEDAMNGGKVEKLTAFNKWVDCDHATWMITPNKYLRMKESRLKTTGEKHHA